jgi:hypothetical protein
MQLEARDAATMYLQSIMQQVNYEVVNIIIDRSALTRVSEAGCKSHSF